jgi:hypothetical protein
MVWCGLTCVLPNQFAGTFPDLVDRLILVEAIGPLIVRRPEQAITQLANAAANIRAAPKRPRVYSSMAECIDRYAAGPADLSGLGGTELANQRRQPTGCRMAEGNPALTREAAAILCERGVWECEIGMCTPSSPGHVGAAAGTVLYGTVSALQASTSSGTTCG